MKKIAAVFMVFVLTLVSADTVSAGGRLISENNTYEDFTYSVSAFGDCGIEILAQLTAYHGEAEHLAIPGSVPCNGGKFRVNKYPSLFRFPEKIRQITLGSVLRYQGEFAELPNLESVQYQKEDRKAYSRDGVFFYDFMGGVWLKIFPRGKKDASYRMPENVAILGPYAFANCKNLRAVTLSKNLTQIDDYAFSGCTSLQKIIVPKRVTYIGPGALKNCSARVKMPSNMKKVKDSSKEGFHYELYVKCRLKKKPRSAIKKKRFRDIDEISPAAKKVTIKKKKKRRLVTHFKIKKKTYTLYSDCLQYTSSNPKVAAVNDKGVVKAKKKGTAKITVRHSWLYDYNSYAMGIYTVKVKVR